MAFFPRFDFCFCPFSLDWRLIAFLLTFFVSLLHYFVVLLVLTLSRMYHSTALHLVDKSRERQTDALVEKDGLQPDEETC